MSETRVGTAAVLEDLKDPTFIRRQANRMLELAKQDKLRHFSYNPEQMAKTAGFVCDVIRHNYPELNIPYHSRWRHFQAGGVDRLALLEHALSGHSPTEKGRILYEAVIVSVLLDAGAGPTWHYRESSTDRTFARSEGLAVASLDFYLKGTLSSHQDKPWRVDASRLKNLSARELGEAFQVTDNNPLAGLDGRTNLLNRLGHVIESQPAYFNNSTRLGGFYDFVHSVVVDQKLSARQLFGCVMEGFANIWPKRLTYGGQALGDVWRHEALHTGEEGSDLIPFHKLSQWLTYSLIEPLEGNGVSVVNLDELTGLPEYRNGGLFIDMGVLKPRDQQALRVPQSSESELIIEWRGLTVALLDQLAIELRSQLGLSHKALPLAKVLQGGSWEAGRRIARQLRADGGPPIQIISDGTVF